MASLLALSLPAGAAGPVPVYQPDNPVVACVDPKASLLLTRPDARRRHTPQWRHALERRGRCFTVGPDTRWERISTLGGLVLMRRTPPQAGLPPLYFRATQDFHASVAAPAMPQPAFQSLPSAEPVISAMPPIAITEETLPPRVAPPARPVMPPYRAPPPTPALPALVMPASTAPVASRRGYEAGFAIAVLLIILLLAALALLLRFVLRRAVAKPVEPASLPQTPQPGARVRIASTERLARLRAAGTPRRAARRRDEEADAQRRCAALLREAGWQVRIGVSAAAADTGPGGDRGIDRGADLVARRDGRVLALRCPPMARVVDEAVVEEACMSRERERADRAAVVSEAPIGAGARKLALQTGIDLLQPDQLKTFAR